MLDRYGRTLFGQSALIARRLVEAGVRFVNVTWDLFWDRVQIDYDAWDTHTRNFPILKENKLPGFDQVFTALLEDLDARGLLDETLIVMCGEMGRTPKVNAGTGESRVPGRDHWGAVQSVFVAGGGIPGGVVVGESDKDGAYPAKAPQRPENLAATIYHALGIPATAAWKDELNRPHQIYHGEPIEFA